MDSLAQQMNTNMTFNSRSSGSIAATASSGHTAPSVDEDLGLALMPNMRMEYGQQAGSYDLMNQTLGNSKSFWNSAVASRYSSPNPGLENLLESPQLDDQGIQLPSFMSNNMYTPGNQDAFNPAQYSQSNERVPFNAKDYNINNRKAAVKESAVGPLQPFISQYGSNNQIVANSQKKKIGYAGTFNPRVASYDGRTTSPETKTSTISGSNTYAKSYNPGTQAIDAGGSDSHEMLEIELSYKTEVNKAMYAKLLSLNAADEGTSENETFAETKESLNLPQKYFQLFRDLTHTLNERTHELEETKSIMEAILVGLVMTKDSTITTNGTFDAQDLAHKITNKMSVLQSENEALLKMVSHSNKQSLVIELGVLKSENHALREKIKEMGLQDA